MNGRGALVGGCVLAAVAASMLLDDGIPERIRVSAQAETPGATITATLEVSPTLTLTPTVEATAVVTPTLTATATITPTATIDYPATVAVLQTAVWYNRGMVVRCQAELRACLATPAPAPVREPVRFPLVVKRW